MAGVKYSRQREAIQMNLVGRYDHPTADMVYEDIRKEYPHISLGTVYRNLSLLAQHGEIQKLAMADGPDRFDGNPHLHYHFCCRKCGQVIDFPIQGGEEQLTRQAAKGFAGHIDGQFVQFFGTCPQCM